MKVVRNYGNGFTVEVEGDTMKELIENLAQADEVFYDVRAYGKDDSGNFVISDKVKFSARYVQDKNGRPCTYLEQICTEGPLKWYKRHIGSSTKKEGGVYVQTSMPNDMNNRQPGMAGWTKYIGQSGGEYNANGNGHAPQQQYGQPRPQFQPQHAPQQPQYAPPPQGQYAPQQQQYSPQQHAAPVQQNFNPHAAPPQYAAASVEDVPF